LPEIRTKLAELNIMRNRVQSLTVDEVHCELFLLNVKPAKTALVSRIARLMTRIQEEVFVPSTVSGAGSEILCR
jgi:hypothetical protein